MEEPMADQDLSDPVTHRLPKDILEKLEAIAKASDRSRSWYVVRALRFYFAGEGADILNAIEGRAEIERGEKHDMDDVLREIDAIVRDKVA
jgi:predicted transcriptional regulator